jgi:tetratricopeptide (TPR) repeat protein
VGLPRSNNEVPSSRSSDLAVRSLKAGIGVARTLFSIGVVARFDDLGGVRVPIPPRPGYFEHHRLILRWMLLRASNIGSVSAVGTATGKSRKSHGTMQMPFYPDEMIWLFNECGVFSLAQGQMFEAIAMFDAALKGAEAIEGEANSSIRRRILLNLALCSIYRGRPNEARRQLTEIQSEESEDEAVQLIATGHLGLLDHIGGFNESAMHRLSEAIKGLIKLRRFRAVSMFLRHRGDLHRDLHDFGSAKKDLVEAIDLARLSGSQDMAWFAIVARTRLDVTEGVDLRESAKRLEDAERYADAMELPLLTSETCFVHAQMLLRQGETALAAEKVTKALRLATLHGLTLRSIAYRNLLADIHLERGWSEEAKKIRGQALQAARSAGYRLMLQRHPQGTA